MKIADQLVDSSFSAIINAPIKKINIPEWAFNLPEKEYQDLRSHLDRDVAHHHQNSI
jgi:hypothetical protein